MCVTGGFSRAPVTKGKTVGETKTQVKACTQGVGKGLITTAGHKRWGVAADIALWALEEGSSGGAVGGGRTRGCE